jgi:hypothetical protein
VKKTVRVMPYLCLVRITVAVAVVVLLATEINRQTTVTASKPGFNAAAAAGAAAAT